jgi:hypothetical protein
MESSRIRTTDTKGGGFLPWAWYQAAPHLGLPLGRGIKEGRVLTRKVPVNGGSAPESSKNANGGITPEL